MARRGRGSNGLPGGHPLVDPDPVPWQIGRAHCGPRRDRSSRRLAVSAACPLPSLVRRTSVDVGSSIDDRFSRAAGRLLPRRWSGPFGVCYCQEAP